MTIYFIGNAELNAVKIGYSRQTTGLRLSSLQTASPYKLEILAVANGDRRVESRLHARFAAQRMNGEWFRRTAELDALIAGLKRQFNPNHCGAMVQVGFWVTKTERNRLKNLANESSSTVAQLVREVVQSLLAKAG